METRHRDPDRVRWFFALTAAAYNLIHLLKFLAALARVCPACGQMRPYDRQIAQRSMKRGHPEAV